nr:sushi, nidogen and EGF-like domain-containing protein 1 [Lytechinus pictus]
MEIRTNIADKLLLLLLSSLTSLCCVCLLLGKGTEAYPTGAPPFACLDMLPVGHGTDGQTTSSPYSISVDVSSYSPGGLVTVRISGDESLRGLLIQARPVGTPPPFGTWTDYPDNFQTINCFSTGDSLTHTENSDKNPADMTFVWQAPSAGGVGDIHFVATFVQERTIFWLDVTSSILRERGPNPCLSDPCQNEGRCFSDAENTQYACLCPGSFSGINCEITDSSPTATSTPALINPCLSDPCQNGGSCFSQSDNTAYRCMCPDTFIGTNCEAIATILQTTVPPTTGPCSLLPCQNGGQCFMSVDDTEYTCFCPSGFTGTNCELSSLIALTTHTPTGPCVSFPCQKGGQCFMSVDDTGYTCLCPSGFTGMNCESSSLTASTTHAPTGPCVSFPCQNGGQCFMSVDDTGYTCLCPTGYTGMNCELSTLTGTTTPTPTGKT